MYKMSLSSGRAVRAKRVANLRGRLKHRLVGSPSELDEAVDPEGGRSVGY